MRSLRFLLLPGLLLTIGLPSAYSDDWPQFRRDANRSAASRDSLRFPLKEAWTWETKSRYDHTPLYYASVWRGHVYFTAMQGEKRYLICAEADTGKVKWSHQLAAPKLAFALSDVAGPAVGSDGKVYVYDWLFDPSIPVPPQASQPKEMDDVCDAQGVGSSMEAPSTFAVRTFDALTGKQGSYFPMALMGANGVLPRLSLMHDGDGQEVTAVPTTFLGCPP